MPVAEESAQIHTQLEEDESDRNLVELEADAREGDEQRHQHADDGSGQETEQEAVGLEGNDESGHGRKHEAAFHRQVDDSGFLGDRLSDHGKDQRGCREDEGVEFVHPSPPQSAGSHGRGVVDGQTSTRPPCLPTSEQEDKEDQHTSQDPAQRRIDLHLQR